ncbi:hypothetical protein BDA96_01G119900 [Sorghum bicolor]|uniref:Uncharacterized protein n=2 Tax=Sorghum bicolor TaxID=4558 RepID=A0A921RZA3_SORBI|nr:hypothetical protein BDA96_01G119900 [Sorghum bicolor]
MHSRMTMKRPAAMYALLPLLVVLAASSFLFQVSGCSRPPPEESRTIPRQVLRRDGEPHVQQHHRDNADGTGTTRPAGLEMEAGTVEKGATRAEDGGGVAPSSAASAPARDMVGHHQVDSGSSDLGGAPMMMATRPPVRLRSELPRRVLAGAPPVVEGAADSAAKSSCHSSDVHINCPPSSRN